MSSVVQRTINASPQRTAGEVWSFITELIAPEDGSPARIELNAVAGIASGIIGARFVRTDPIVIYGNGPRVRIYCVYDETAANGDKASEGKLAFVPTENDWKLSFPCSEEDYAFFQSALKGKSGRFSIRKLGALVDDDLQKAEEAKSDSSSQGLGFDPNAFLEL